MKKKIVFLSMVMLLCITAIVAQVPYYGNPFYKEGFDQSSITTTGWTQSGTSYSSASSAPTTTAWVTNGAYIPAGKNFVNIDPTSTHSLYCNVLQNNGLIGFIESPEIANSISGQFCVGFSSYNNAGSPNFPAGNGYFAFQISKDNGVTWEDMWRSDEQKTKFDYTVTAIPITFAGWSTVRVSLPSSYNGQNFKLRFYITTTTRTSNLQLYIDGVFASPIRHSDVQMTGVNNYISSSSIPSFSPNRTAFFETPIAMQIANMGTAPVSKIYAGYQLEPTGQVVYETVTLPTPVASGEKASFTLKTKANLTALRTPFTLKAWASIAGDEYRANDTLSFYLDNIMTDVPYKPAWFVVPGYPDDEWVLKQANTATLYPRWDISKVGTDTVAICDASSKTENGNSYYFSRPLNLKAGRMYEMVFDTKTNSTNASDVNTLQIYTTTKIDTLSREGEFLFNKADVNNTRYLNQKVYILPTKDTSYYVVLHALCKAGAKPLCVYNLNIREVGEIDAAVMSVVSPQNGPYRYTNNEQIAVKIGNPGMTAIEAGSIKIYYQLNGGTVIQETITAALAVGATTTHTFTPKADMSALSAHTLKVWLELDGDVVTSNNQLEVTLAPQLVELPHDASFGTNDNNLSDESNFWTSVSTNASYKWAAFSSATDASWRFGNLTVVNTATTATLYSRPIHIEAGTKCVFSYALMRTNANANYPLSIGLYKKTGNSYTLVQTTRTITITTAANVYATYQDDFTVTETGDYYYGFTSAVSSIRYFIHVKNVYFGYYVDNDLAISDVLLPGLEVANLNQLPIGVTVKNGGKNIANSYTVSYQINDGTPVTESVSSALPTGTERVFYFTNKALFAGSGTENVKTWVTLAGDELRTNDTMTVSVRNVDVATVPYTINDFAPIADWLAFDANKNGICWAKCSTPISGYKYASTATADDYLLTKQVSLTAGKRYKVSFEAMATSPSKPMDIGLYTAKGNQVEQVTNFANYSNITQVNPDNVITAYFSATETASYAVAFRVQGATNNNAVVGNTFSITEAAGLPDLSVAIAYPTIDGLYYSDDSVVVAISNVGQDAISGFPLTCTVNGTTILSTMIYETIPAGGSLRYSIPNVDMYNQQAYTIVASTFVNFDPNHANDAATVTVNCIPYNDIQLLELSSPFSGKTKAAAPVSIQIKNVGNKALTSVPVAYKVGSNAAITEATGVIAMNGTIDYTFAAPLNLSTPGTYSLKVYTAYPDDKNRLNDTISRQIVVTNQTVDVQMLAINSPVTGPLTKAENVRVTVKNNTSIPLTVPVVCTIDNNQTLTGSVDVPASSAKTYTFPQTVDMSAVATYSLVTYTDLDDDQNRANDTVKTQVSYIAKDLGVSQIISPTTPAQLSTTTPITVQIYNYGVTTVSSTPISYKINNRAAVDETITFPSGGLSPNSSYEYTFSQTANITGEARYTILVYTKLPDDVERRNDTARVSIASEYGDPVNALLVGRGGAAKSGLTGNGEMFVSYWRMVENGGFNLYAQRLNQKGGQTWATERKISNSALTFGILDAVCADHAGNYIMGYTNMRESAAQFEGEVNLSKINANGDFVFGETGKTLVPYTTTLQVVTNIKTDSRNDLYVTISGKSGIFKIDGTTGNTIKTGGVTPSCMMFDREDNLYVAYSSGGGLKLQIYDTNLNPKLSTPPTLVETGVSGASIMVFDEETGGLWICYQSYDYRNTFYVQYVDQNYVRGCGNSGVPVSTNTWREKMTGWPAFVPGEGLAFIFTEQSLAGTAYSYIKAQKIKRDGTLVYGTEGKDIVTPAVDIELMGYGLEYIDAKLVMIYTRYAGTGTTTTGTIEAAFFTTDFTNPEYVTMATAESDPIRLAVNRNHYGVFSTWSEYTAGRAKAQHLYFDQTIENKAISINVTSSDYTKGYAEGGGMLKIGESAVLEAYPVPGYAFKGWLRNGVMVSTTTPYTFTVLGENTYTALFTEGCNAPQNVTVTTSFDGQCRADIVWQAPSSGATGVYNIYRGGQKIASNITGTSYRDEGFAGGTYTWCVATVCSEGGESPKACAQSSCEAPIFTITSSASSGGVINPAGTITVTYGSNKAYTFTSITGYELKEVLIDGVNDAGAVSARSYTFGNVTSDHTIVANFDVIKSTIVATAGANGTISPGGNVLVNYGENQTFHIQANSGYAIDKVLIDGVNNTAAANSGEYTFTNVRIGHTIAASFTEAQYTITSTTDFGGTIAPLGVIGAAQGDNKIFTIIPNPGYIIKTVLVDGINNAAAVSSGSYTFTNITANHTISATFEQVNHTITVTCGNGGNVYPGGTVLVSEGTDKTFQIVANNGYKIQEVLVDGVSNAAAISSGIYTFENVTASHTLEARFEASVFTITATADAHGTINPQGTISANYGDSKSFTITPAAGYTIKEVLVDGVNNAAAVTSGNYTFTNITGHHTISATFEGQQPKITDITINGNSLPVTNAMNYMATCGEQGISIILEGTGEIRINGELYTPGTTRAISYTNHKADVVITATVAGVGTISYTLTITEALGSATPLYIERWGATIAIVNNPANNGGYTFDQIQWYKASDNTPAGTGAYVVGNISTHYADVHAVETGAWHHTCRTKATPAPVQIVVYPNPVLAAQTLNVNLPEGLNEVNIDVYDINGKLVKQHPRVTTTLTAPAGTGIYVLKIQLPDGSITTEKIVVK